MKDRKFTRDRWETIWQRLGARTVWSDVYDELIRAYSSPGRFYHDLVHIEDCLSLFDQTKFLASRPEEVELAICFHDAVYDTKRSDNEQKSAAWAEAVMSQAGISTDSAKRISRSILATRHNVEVTNTDAQLMVDLDLSILGRKGDVFWRYEENIRKEYTWVPEDLFREKRVEILRGFLEREHIYYHKEYRERFEEQARENLKEAISRLRERQSC